MKHKNWYWGLYFLAAGFFVIASQVSDFVHLGFWSIVATVLLSATLISSIANISFFGTLMSTALLYAIYQKPFELPYVGIWPLLLTAVFLSTGLHFIFHKKTRNHWGNHHNWKSYIDSSNFSEECVDGDSLYISESFSETSKYLHANCLREAHISSSFGKLSVYFDGVHLSADGAEVYVDGSFGKIEMYLPKEWKIVEQIHTYAGAVTNNLHHNTPTQNLPTLTLKGRVSFGNIELRYI